MRFLLFFPGYYHNSISQVESLIILWKTVMLESNPNFLMSSINRGVLGWDRQPNLFIIISQLPGPRP